MFLVLLLVAVIGYCLFFIFNLNKKIKVLSNTQKEYTELIKKAVNVATEAQNMSLTLAKITNEGFKNVEDLASQFQIFKQYVADFCLLTTQEIQLLNQQKIEKSSNWKSNSKGDKNKPN